MTTPGYNAAKPLGANAPESVFRAWMEAVERGGDLVAPGATGVMKIGDPAYAPETLTYSPNGTDVRFAVSDTAMELHYDNIATSKNAWLSGLAGSNITWKSKNPNVAKPRIPHLNIGFINSGIGTVIFEAGGVQAMHASAGVPVIQFPLGFNTQDSAGASRQRLFINSGDNDAVSIGETMPWTEQAGAFLHIHARYAAQAAHTHYSTLDTGYLGNQGASVGVWTDKSLRMWNYSNNPVRIGVNNVEIATLDGTNAFFRKVSAGAVTSSVGAVSVNTASGRTAAFKMAAQDDNAGTIRGLIYAPGPVNAGVYDQGSLGFFVEDGSKPIAMLISSAAAAAGLFYLYDRGAPTEPRIIMQAGAASPFVNITGTTAGALQINGTKVLGARDTGWAADTGTAKKTANATYSGTASAGYVQAEMQALMNAVRDATQTQKSLKDSLINHGIMGA